MSGLALGAEAGYKVLAKKRFSARSLPVVSFVFEVLAYFPFSKIILKVAIKYRKFRRVRNLES